MKCAAVIVAAGRGKRMGTALSKQYLPLMGKPVLAHCIDVFERCPLIGDILIVSGIGETDYCSEILAGFGFTKIRRIIEGGAERQHSVYKGLKALPSDTEMVLIHDGVRPFVSMDILMRSIEQAQRYGTAIAGMPAKDTIKKVDGQGFALDTPDRSKLWVVQTPQTFRYPLILQAHEKAEADGFLGTDDAVLVERAGHAVKMIEGSYENIKITTPEDLAIGEAILRMKPSPGEKGRFRYEDRNRI